MISRPTSSNPKEDDVFPRLLYCHLRSSQTWYWCCQRLPGLWLVLKGFSPVLWAAPSVVSTASRCFQTCHNHSQSTPVPVTRDSCYSECWQECPPRVWYFPEIDASKCTLHILSNIPGGFQCLKWIMLMSLYGREEGEWWKWWCKSMAEHSNDTVGEYPSFISNIKCHNSMKKHLHRNFATLPLQAGWSM